MKRSRSIAARFQDTGTNTVIYMIKGKVNITDKTSLTMTYQYLTAPDSTPSTGVYALSPTEFTNQGKVKGQLPTAILSQTFSKKPGRLSAA